MSHVSKYAQKVKDLEAFAKVLLKRKYKHRVGKCVVKQYGRNEVEAELGFQPPGWRYEIAVTDSGEILYDHWGSDKGTMELLGETLQEYNENVISAEALMNCDNFYSEELKNGDKKLVLEWN